MGNPIIQANFGSESNLKDREANRPKLTRRDVLSSAAATAAFAGVPQLSFAQTPDLIDVVTRRVRDIVGGRSVTLRLLMPNGSGGNVAPVVAAFAKMTGVAVETSETQVDEMNTELTLDALSNSQKYDVALPATFGLPDLVQAGAIRPITDFAAQYEPSGFRDDILFGVGDTYDDEIYGFQTDGDAYVMFYNKRMLQNPSEADRYADLYGIPLEIARTWEELDRQMAFFNRPDDGMWGGLLFRTAGYLSWEWWMRFHAKGVWPFTPDMTPQIASDQGIAALEEMIAATAHLAPETGMLGLFENWERFGRGDVFCNIGWGGTQKYLMGPASAMRDNMVYGQTPGGVVNGVPINVPYFNWGWNYVVTQNARNAELAYLFTLFAATSEMSTLAVQQTDGFFDPFRPEHYSDRRIETVYSPEFLDIHRASMVAAIPDLYLRNQGEYFRVLTEWLSRALRGDATPKEALQRAASQWLLITNSVDRSQQAVRWNRLRGKYPAELRAQLQDL